MRDPDGNTLLHLDAKRPTNTMSVHNRVQRKEIPFDTPNGAGQTALHLAAGNSAIVKLDNLLDAEPKPNVDALDNNGETPLFYAVRANLEDNVEALILVNAKVDIRNKKGETIFHLLAEKNFYKLTKFLWDDKLISKVDWLKFLQTANLDGLTPLHVAAMNDSQLFVKQVLEGIGKEERSSIVNQTTPKGNSPLHYACDRGHLALFLLLQNMGGESTKNDLGKEPEDFIRIPPGQLDQKLKEASRQFRKVMGLPPDPGSDEESET